MSITHTQDGFEEEKGHIVQGSMPGGFSPSSAATTSDEGITLHEIVLADTMYDIPGLDDEKIVFIEVHSRSTNTGLVYLTDPQGVAGDPTDNKSGREIEPSKSAAYPLRGRSDLRGRPRVWSDTAGQLYTITRGYLA